MAQITEIIRPEGLFGAMVKFSCGHQHSLVKGTPAVIGAEVKCEKCREEAFTSSENAYARRAAAAPSKMPRNAGMYWTR